MVNIPYGISNFERIRNKEEPYVYVDKTHFLRSLEHTAYLMHLRPRRFGKSLFISMMDCYYDVALAHKFDELFTGLAIHKQPTANKNNYYILRFNFSGIENSEIDGLKTGFLRRTYLDAKRFIDRYELDIKLGDKTSPAGVLDDLLTGFEKLKLPHKIYMLIDEYDHFTNSILYGDGDAFLSVLKRGGYVRSFYEIIKERTERGVVERLFMTGVMSVTLDSMTSGFNIVTKITTNKNYADMMGFTTDEVKALLKLSFKDTSRQDGDHYVHKPIRLTDEERLNIFEVFKENYNGYLFSEENGVKIFNSTMIMYYLQNYIADKEPPKTLVDANLNQSGTTIASIINLKTPELNQALIQELIDNKEVVGTLEPFIDIDKKFDQDDVVTMLYNIGILTIKKDESGGVFEIPNTIIKRIYLQYLSELMYHQLDYTIDMRKQRIAFREIGTTGKINALTKIVENLLSHLSNENFKQLDEKYVKFIYFILTHVTEDFIVYDEFPAGSGYSDIFIQKTLTTRAKYEVLIELKYLKRKQTTEETIQKKLQEGITQINQYMKDERLANRDGLKKYVVVFSAYEAVKIHEVND